jgi:hypothetical protein
MSDSDDNDDLLYRFSNRNPVVETERIVFDVSNIPVGHLDPLPDPNGELSPDSLDFLRRDLFPEASAVEAPAVVQQQQEHHHETPHNTTNGTDIEIVTMGGTSSATPAAGGGGVEHSTLSTSQPRQQRRKRVKFWKQLFYASSELYLKLDPSFPFPHSTPDLVGLVVSCPSKRNDNHYIIEWQSPRLDGVEWPANLRHHLITKFHKSKIHSFLPDWIAACPDNNNRRQGTNTTTTTTTTTTTMLPPPPPPGPRGGPDTMPPPLDNVVITTPAQPPPLEQRMAFAALHTAGSGPSLYSQTEFSSLGASNRSPDGFTPHTPQRHEQPMDVDDDSDDEDIAPVQRQRQDRSTRSTSTVLGNDFDREDTDDEAGFEVDFSDNFWTAPPTTIPTSERVARGEYGDDHDPPPPDATSDQEDDDDDEATTFHTIQIWQSIWVGSYKNVRNLILRKSKRMRNLKSYELR